MTQYPTFEDFKKAWSIAQDKARFASELLLEDDNWGTSFEIRYGYKVDEFDIIAYFGYDIEPPMSKHQRTLSAPVALYLERFDDIKKKTLRLLLDAYAETNFVNLRDVKNIFQQQQFREIGLTPTRVLKEVFKSREAYFKCLEELENKLYE